MLTATLPLPSHSQDLGKAPEYLRFFDPAKGFKPAQANLAEIFLQLAGSLEAEGSPEPYVRHILAEHQRVARLYQAKTGRQLPSHLPPYMTPAYVDQFIANWKLLEPKLKLDNLSRDAGLCIRKAIRGTQGTGTMLVSIFDRHKQLVTESRRGAEPDVGFKQLQFILSIELDLTEPGADPSFAGTVKRETALTEAEQKEFAALIIYKRFTKAHFPALERFYSGPYDKLSEAGKDELSMRVWGACLGLRRIRLPAVPAKKP